LLTGAAILSGYRAGQAQDAADRSARDAADERIKANLAQQEANAAAGRAVEQQKLAEQRARIAQSLETAAQARTSLATAYASALLLSVYAYQIHPTLDAHGALLVSRGSAQS
jgi:hypothetical protein